ncbi:MAG: aromatic ring-hydroxylating dioxygenase subunit alpha, partial [Acidimicrobiales bacterium]|nr:aromatic ring-hydroxylating dioxygenase subunit alpha [Acidimicrobiales bacterium]
MSRELLVQLARRTMAHAQAGTQPLADGVREVPVGNYTDPDRWQLEIDRIFKRVPLLLGPSCELAEPGSYRALEIAGVPILLSRGADGELRSFVNMCSHRGAVLMEPGSGSARRFTCPYHAWSYDQQGTLVGILDREDFGPVDTSCHGLTPLPVGERAGLIFGSLTPRHDGQRHTIDLDAALCGYDAVFEHLGLADQHLVGRQQVDGPNWKVAYDGYLDLYHLPILHKATFGPDYSNKAVFDAWGPHQRSVQPDHRMAALADIPEAEWSQKQLTSGVWTIFPHVSIAGFVIDRPSHDSEQPGDTRLQMISQLLPGPDQWSSVTVQHFLAPFEPTAEEQAVIEE